MQWTTFVTATALVCARDRERVVQQAEISYWLTVYAAKDRFIVGDFNTEEDKPELEPMRYWYTDQWNVRAEVIETMLSDHKPLVVDYDVQ